MPDLKPPSILTMLIDRLKPEEGAVRNAAGRHIVYLDPKGIPTIGYGRNARDRGLSDAEALYLLENDAAQIVVELARAWIPFALLDPVRKLVVADLYFNMSLGNPAGFVSEFKSTLDLIAAGDYAAAASHMRGWTWYHDVGPKRADPLIEMMRTGQLAEATS